MEHKTVQLVIGGEVMRCARLMVSCTPAYNIWLQTRTSPRDLNVVIFMPGNYTGNYAV